jgi:hypothetical protein
MEIIETEWGLASRVGDRIYINKKLKNNQLLYGKILEHEQNHSKSLKLSDFLMDIDIKELKGLKKQYYRFIIRNPKTWTIFLPIIIKNKSIQLDLGMLVIWILLLSCIISIIITF